MNRIHFVRISCLHADAASIAEFEAAAPSDMRLVHFLSGPKGPRTRAALRAETGVLLSRAARGSDAVLVTCPHLCELAPPPAVTFLRLLGRAIRGFPGSVEAIGVSGQVTASLRGAVEQAGARLVLVTSPEQDGGASLAARLGESDAAYLVLLDRRLKAPGRAGAHGAAALALSAMAGLDQSQ